MEEQVGQIWHKLVTRLASQSYPEATVKLSDIHTLIGIYFRAIGGNPGLEIAQAQASAYDAKRSWLRKIAWNREQYSFTWTDETALRLPEQIAVFDRPQLNRDLYLWLAAMASVRLEPSNDWLIDNQRRTRQVLQYLPGLMPRYRQMVEIHCAQRSRNNPKPDRNELNICQALIKPGSVTTPLSAAPYQPQPVPLWLHPSPPVTSGQHSRRNEHEPAQQQQGRRKDASELGKKSSREVDSPEEHRGLIAMRMENIFSWGEFTPLDRSTDDEDDEDAAIEAARDMDQLALSRQQQSSSITLKFDLDLPSADIDDTPVGQGIRLPEWNWKRGLLEPDRCRLVPMLCDDASDCDLPEHLQSLAKGLRRQFQSLILGRRWQRAQADGDEIDLNACVQSLADRKAGYSNCDQRLYQSLSPHRSDLGCLLLADLSLSTDSWVDDRYRVIDVIQDSLFLFAECLHATADTFALFGFSSRGRDPIRYHLIKHFNEAYQATIRGRIAALKPGYYTRMGAAIRHSTELLRQQQSEQRLLLVLSDGKPNDIDIYEGRYGIEDTRQAVLAARRLGIKLICITIDQKANEYLPYVFGRQGYVLVRKAVDLPKALLVLYARMRA